MDFELISCLATDRGFEGSQIHGAGKFSMPSMIQNGLPRQEKGLKCAKVCQSVPKFTLLPE